MKRGTKVPHIKLNDGLSIPQIGLGLWKVKDPSEFRKAFSEAIQAGYRHFDSAQVYGNEDLLGDAWVASDINREEFFLTTKIAIENFRGKRIATSFDESLRKLRTDYVDLLLLHFPVSIFRKQAWAALTQLQEEGKARSIGVSNYTIRHLKEMKRYTDITPAINQVELHVFLQQPKLVEYCKKEGIVLEAYSPLAHGKNMDEPIIHQIAKKHSKTYAQIMLRWCIEKGFIVLPKSVTPERVKENMNVFDFELNSDDMQKLHQLDSNLRTCWDPTLIP